MSTMTVSQLVTALQDAIGSSHRLAFTGDLVGSPDLDPLLTTYFAGGTVNVDGASATASENGASAVVSGTVTFGKAACGVGLVLTPGATDVALVLTLTPPTGWTLPQVFPGVLDPTMTALVFASGGLVICSVPYTEPSQGLTLQPGLTLIGTLDLATSYPYLVPVVGAAPLAIHGVVTDPVVPLVVLQTTPVPAKLGGVPLAEVALVFTLGDLAKAGDPPISTASAELQATISLGQGVGGVVTVDLPTSTQTLAVDIAFVDVNLGDLALLEPFIGDADPVASLPSEVRTALTKAASQFELTSLGLTFDLQTLKFLSVDIVVTINLRGFGPFQAIPLLTIDDLVIEWSVDLTATPAATTFSATADIEMASTPPCPVSLGFQSQPGGDYLIFVRENTTAVLKLADLVEVFLPGLKLPELDVTGLAITLAPRDELYTFAAKIDGSWTVLESIGIEMATVTVQALYSGNEAPPLSGSITGTIEFEVHEGASAAAALIAASDDPGVVPPPGVFDVILSATRPEGVDGWLLLGQTGPDQVVPVGDLIAALVRKFKVPSTVPASLASLTIENLGVQFDTVKENFTFGFQIDLEIDGEPVEIVVDVSVTKTGATYDTSFGGTVIVGSLEFDLHFDETSTTTSIVAVYTHKPGDPEHIALRDLVKEISPTAAADVPADIEIQLDGVKLVFVKSGDVTEFAFGLDLSLSFGLQDLPLVGHLLPAESVSIEHLQVLYSTAKLTPGDAVKINALLPSTVAPLPVAGLSPGPAVTATVALGSVSTPIAFGVPTAAAAAPKALSASTSASVSASSSASLPPTAGAREFLPAQGKAEVLPAAASASPPTSAPTAHWFDIQKTIGPVSIGRIGVQYQDSTLFFLLDASMSLAALTVGLDGVGLGSPLTEFKPKGHLDGLSISFTDGPVSINGGFLVAPDPPAGVTDEYMGELTIAIEPYLISGVGAYAKVNGANSFFVFAEVDGEFGGPPAFFVTGFMGGVGYNWSLALPAPDQVYTFPFIAGLGNPTFFGNASPTPIQVLSALAGGEGKPAWVTPSEGENWLAAGIQFRSFELVVGRLLAVAEFGKEFEIALLGLATLALPQGSAADAYAYVELQLEIVLKPDDGVFFAIASLTPNSFLLTKECHLTGGFAFCLWFGSNPHAGDFVLTIGGYHPAFKPPDWYPAVPRLGLNWAVDTEVSIKGGVYFAITPTAAMAGGSLEVLFQAGNLKAWLTAYTDVMIRWRPFYLTADAGISVGVSYKLDLLFTTVTLSVELGASINLWGPPTGGIVHVDWYIISFSIGFGAGEKSAADLTLGWTGFQALLPSTTKAASPVAGALGSAGSAAGTTSTPAVLGLTISGGLLTTDSSTGDWIVRADELVLTSTSAVPITAVTFGSAALAMPDHAPATIDIRPMGESGVTSTHAITLTPAGESPASLSGWPTPTIQTAALPEALWGAPIPNSASPAPAAKLVDGLPTGLVFSPPPATAGSAIGPVDPDSLVTPLAGGVYPLAPASQADPMPEPVADTGTILAIAADVASAASIAVQASLVAALADVGAAPPTSAPLTQLGQQAGSLFAQPPMRTA